MVLGTLNPEPFLSAPLPEAKPEALDKHASLRLAEHQAPGEPRSSKQSKATSRFAQAGGIDSYRGKKMEKRLPWRQDTRDFSLVFLR